MRSVPYDESNTFLIIILILFFCSVFARRATHTGWTWIGGYPIPDQPGIYGSMGVPNSNNGPGGRYLAYQWFDSKKNLLWLYGGVGFGNSQNGPLSDLWNYNVNTSQWTWVNGLNQAANLSASYGTKGVPSPSNTPGSRNAGTTWIDSSGNLWLFGGYLNWSPSSYLNDLWVYTPQTNQWTWVAGSNTLTPKGNYGTLGVPSSETVPGARAAAAGWIDQFDNLWLYGGSGWNDTTPGGLSDMWKFNPQTKQWVWVSGSSQMNADVMIAAPKGVPSANNTPGSFDHYVTFQNGQEVFWVFTGRMIWQYFPNLTQWAWINGNATYQWPVYGNRGVPNKANMIGYRGSELGWIDNSSQIWIFAGLGYNSLKTSYSSQPLNDLWNYDVAKDVWTWVSGPTVPQQLGIYGYTQVPNIPGSRYSSVAWTNEKGQAWVFGGMGNGASGQTGMLNDLWRFDYAL